MIKLRLIQSGHAAEQVTIDGNEAVIGRAPDCDLVIPQAYVSKRHVRILRGLVVIDLDSRNGTYVESRRIRGAVLLSGTQICLGDEDAVVEVDAADDGAHTRTAVLPARADKDDLRARNESLQKALEFAQAQLTELRRVNVVPGGEPLADTARLDRDKIELESRVRSQSLEIERLRQELEAVRGKR